ncbi:MAG TPA: DHA2 family efflux MFS transporter permease subunit [Caulobacteraceae bacterium]|jgi:DHA2 family multidrug resistance protein|nr:DHA2 family efflux MFS transporter permease subunit [Caulobacteraceae bacterium]
MAAMVARGVAAGDAPAEGTLAASLSEPRKLAIFLIMAVGQFMAVLDIQIVASAIGALQAGLSAAPDEVAWLQTAYLMAEIVMIPLSAFLAQALSTRWLFVLSAGLFTLASLACGIAWDLKSMVLFRAVQGFFGGAMIPLVFATGFSFFHGAKAAMATAVLGVIATLAPTLGPTIGGWITDTLSWRWLFFINIAPGVLVTLALIALGPVDRARPRLLAHIDWLHALSLAVFLGGLQYVLEEGPRRQWFADPTVAAVGWASLVASVVFFERCFFSSAPLVRLRPFARAGFTGASIVSFVIGFGLYAVTYLTPLFLFRVRGFSSFEIGTTVFVAGAFMTAATPAAAWLSSKIDQKLVMAIGLIMFAASFWMISDITPQWGFWQLFWTQGVRGAAVLFCIVPSVGMALNIVPDEDLQDASGLNNLMRNLGGAVGIAMVNTWLGDFFAGHMLALSQGLGAAPDVARQAVADLAARLAASLPDPARAVTAAQASLGQIVGLEALTLAFQDVFRLLAWLFVAALAAVPLCRGGPLSHRMH